jgi:hypothetical protein
MKATSWKTRFGFADLGGYLLADRRFVAALAVADINAERPDCDEPFI